MWADVLGVAPELTRVPLAGQMAIVEVVNSLLDVENWGGCCSPKLALARSLYAAHMGTMFLKRGLPGVPTSSAVGGMSRGYSLVDFGSNSVLQLTSYGLLFMQLARTTPARAGFSTAMSRAPAGLGLFGGWPGPGRGGY